MTEPTDVELLARADRLRASTAALDRETTARIRVRLALRELAAEAVTVLGRGLAAATLRTLEDGWERGH